MPTHPYPRTAIEAVEKFYALTDDAGMPLATMRRVFFEFLGTKPTLSNEEIETIHAVADLLDELSRAHPTKA